MVKLGRLWGDAKFQAVPPLSKLLYCNLCTNPSISTLGVIDVNISILNQSLGNFNYNEHKLPLKEKGYIDFIKREDNWDTVIVVDHYNSLAKSKLTIRKALDEGKSTDPDLRRLIAKYFTKEDFEEKDKYKPPTPQEVVEYGMSEGYDVNGKAFVDYYSENDWYDKNNKRVRNWKSKVKKVWCRESNKLKSVKGFPKGFEYFYVDVEDGVRVFPESWKNGLPSHSNFIYAEHLINKFNEQRGS